jgi:hypothetical protein
VLEPTATEFWDNMGE